MDLAIEKLIRAIHQGPRHYVLAITGGGASAPGLLLSVPGGSHTILEVIVPYHSQALTRFLGSPPTQWCSTETSQAMAARACQRAQELEPNHLVAGLGCTASLVSDRPKRGDHRFHLSIQTSQQVQTWSLTLCKGHRERVAEEELVARVILNAVAEVSEIEERVEIPLLETEQLQCDLTVFDDPLNGLLRADVARVCAKIDGQISERATAPELLVPGSFNPLHRGHVALAEIASRLTGKQPCLEISVENVDKGRVPLHEIRRRLRQLTWRYPVWLTREPTFIGKAELFPGVTFALGVDTAARLLMPRYYKDEADMLRALERIRDLGCRFLVAGRVDDQERFISQDDLSIPTSLQELFVQIPETEMRVDISSTSIRSQ